MSLPLAVAVAVTVDAVPLLRLRATATPTARAGAAVATTSLNPLLKKLPLVVVDVVLAVAALSSPPKQLSSSNIF